jgi:hypothetical protein
MGGDAEGAVGAAGTDGGGMTTGATPDQIDRLLVLLRQMKAESGPVNIRGSGHYAAVPRALWRDLMAVLAEMEREGS